MWLREIIELYYRTRAIIRTDGLIFIWTDSRFSLGQNERPMVWKK